MSFRNREGSRRLKAKGRAALHQAVAHTRENVVEELEPRRMLAAAGPRFAAVPPRANLPGINNVPNGGRVSFAKVQEVLKRVTTSAPANQFDTIQNDGVVDDGGGDTISTVESGPLINIPQFRSTYPGVDGTGYSVVIIDTGIDRDHPFFGPDVSPANGIADRIVFNYDFYSTNDSDASDFNGHGSNVASIAASSDATYKGMAPGANIIALKVFPDGSGGAPTSDIEEALQWCVANAATYNIVSVNLSLGGSTNFPYTQDNDSRSDEFAALVALNVMPVVASGNSFFTFGSAQGVTYPASDTNVISVGAVYDSNSGGWSYSSGAVANTSGADRIAPFSNRHSLLTHIMAPGAPITGANQSGGTVTYHGTSQAAPHIAGIVALAQQLAVTNLGRRLTMDEMRSLLASTGVIINDGDDEDDNVTNTSLNFPRVNVLALGNAIVNMRLGSIAGTAYEDRDSNGSKAVGEPALTRTVYLDSNNNAVLDTGSSSVSSVDIPKTISDQAMFRSNLTASLPGPITDVNVTLNISHTSDQDVDIYLISPSGTRIKLLSDVGSTGDNFTSTILDDAAATNITAGSAPFTGTFKPEEVLSRFNGEDPNGVWKLEVGDDAAANTGTLNSWSLNISYTETSTVTNGSGAYTFPSLAPKAYKIAEVGVAGYIQNTPTGNISLTLSPAQAATNQNFGNFPITFNGSSVNDTYNISTLVGGTTVQILETLGANPLVTYTVPKTTLASNILTFNGSTGDDAFTVNEANGSPVPGSITINGGGQTSGDSLVVSGTSGNDTMSISGGAITFGGTTNVSAIEAITFNGGVGNDTLTIAAVPTAPVTFNGGLTVTDQDILNVNAGTQVFNTDANTATANLALNIAAGAAATFNSTQHLKSLSVAGAGAIATMSANGTRVLVIATTVATTGGGKVQLVDNDMIIKGMTRPAVEALVKAGYGAADWLGTGITSSTAATFAQTDGSRSLGVILNSDWGYGTFDGQSVVGTDVLVKFTYTADANLDGIVDNDDFGQFLYGFNGGGLPTWINADFDFSGVVDNDDFGWFLTGLAAFQASGQVL